MRRNGCLFRALRSADAGGLMLVLAEGPQQNKGCVISVDGQGRADEFGVLTAFRRVFYDFLRRRADALFELTDAVLCTDAPVSSLVGLSPAAEHRRGHGALYDAVNAGRIEVDRLRRS
jgi:hypothetical protein